MTTSSMERRAARVKAAHDIENLLCRYSYYLTAGDTETILNMFAQREDVSVSLSSMGQWTGTEGLKRFCAFLLAARGDGIGQLEIHLVTNLVIEVSEDCSRANAVLVSPGVSTGAPEGDHLSSGWDWARAEVELINEDRTWKFLHVGIYDLFYAPYGHTFVGYSKPAPAVPAEFVPDTARTLDCAYTPDGVQRLLPVPPVPDRKIG